MKSVCKVPLGHMRQITDSLLLYVLCNDVLAFARGLFGDGRVYREVGDGTRPGVGVGGFVFPQPDGHHGIHVISCLELPGEK